MCRLAHQHPALCKRLPGDSLHARPKVPLWTLISFGLILFAVKFTVLFTSLKLGLPAGLASIVLQVQVFFTILFAFLLLGERPGRCRSSGPAWLWWACSFFAEEKIENAALVPILLGLLAAMLWGSRISS